MRENYTLKIGAQLILLLVAIKAHACITVFTAEGDLIGDYTVDMTYYQDAYPSDALYKIDNPITVSGDYTLSYEVTTGLPPVRVTWEVMLDTFTLAHRRAIMVGTPTIVSYVDGAAVAFDEADALFQISFIRPYTAGTPFDLSGILCDPTSLSIYSSYLSGQNSDGETLDIELAGEGPNNILDATLSGTSESPEEVDGNQILLGAGSPGEMIITQSVLGVPEPSSLGLLTLGLLSLVIRRRG